VATVVSRVALVAVTGVHSIQYVFAQCLILIGQKCAACIREIPEQSLANLRSFNFLLSLVLVFTVVESISSLFVGKFGAGCAQEAEDLCPTAGQVDNHQRLHQCGFCK
jgi:hypothetical protein